MGRTKRSVKRAAAFLMAVLLISGKLLPVIPLLPWKAEAARQGDTMTAYGPDFHHYCIDGAGANRALIDGDEYTYILPVGDTEPGRNRAGVLGYADAAGQLWQCAAGQCRDPEYQ